MMGELSKIGPYHVRSVLGRGAMGVVYKAFDPRINRTVVIKTIRRELLEENRAILLARFKVEAESAGKLTHPKIVATYEFSNEQEPPCIVMEYVDGKSLKYHLDRKRQFSIKEAINIVMQLLDGLEHAHKSRIVHRDIKPANIMLTADGKIKITDFGIAHLDTSGLTMIGDVLGTPSYMSPEQWQGMAVDHRSDLYSAGVVLYELLTGQKLFSGQRDPQAQPALPPPLDQVVNKALQKDANERFQSAVEFLLALREIDQEFDRYDEPTQVLLPKAKGGKRAYLIGASLIVCILVASAGFIALRQLDTPPPAKTVPIANGLIQFSSEPQGAVILLDGREFVGVTPTQISLEPGIYEVSFEKQGYHELDLSVEVEPGQEIPVDVILNELTL